MPEFRETGMPNNLVFVRHGESEANVVNQADKQGSDISALRHIKQRADWQQRLTEVGVVQAIQAGEWLNSEFGPVNEVFDKKYASPYVRTRETALHVGGAAATGWMLDHRIVERSWGVFGAATLEEQDQLYRHTKERAELDPLFTSKDGGEALANGVLTRFRDFLDTLHREANGENVLAVTHGEFMWVVRYVLERMTPEEWQKLDDDKSQRLRNCSVLQYTRINPEDNSDVRRKLSWMRIVYPDAIDKSPFMGEWQDMQKPRGFSAEELSEQIDAFPRLLK